LKARGGTCAAKIGPARCGSLADPVIDDAVEIVTSECRALIGPRARDRLDRLLVIADHSSIPSAAQALGLWHSALYQQVVLLERACGGQLVNRRHPAAPRY
jgi:Bacterial regulatory helix-turn-helix protein, lysR family